MKRVIVVFLGIIMLLMFGCTKQVDTQADIQAIRQQGKGLVDAFNQADPDALAVFVTENVFVMPPNQQSVVGVEAVRAYWTEGFRVASSHLEISSEDLQVVVLNSHTHYDHIGGNHQFETIYAMDTEFTRGRALNGRPHEAVAEFVSKGWIWMPLPEGFIKDTAKQTGQSVDEVIAGITKNMPLGEIPKDDDVANACIFFCSDYARMITGETLLVNAGEILR